MMTYYRVKIGKIASGTGTTASHGSTDEEMILFFPLVGPGIISSSEKSEFKKLFPEKTVFSATELICAMLKGLNICLSALEAVGISSLIRVAGASIVKTIYEKLKQIDDTGEDQYRVLTANEVLSQ